MMGEETYRGRFHCKNCRQVVGFDIKKGVTTHSYYEEFKKDEYKCGNCECLFTGE